MKIITLNCPNCGAPFYPPKDKNTCFCGNCGTKMIVDNDEVFININVNERSERINRYIDEARITNAKISAEKQKARYKFILTLIGVFVALFIGFFVFVRIMLLF